MSTYAFRTWIECHQRYTHSDQLKMISARNTYVWNFESQSYFAPSELECYHFGWPIFSLKCLFILKHNLALRVVLRVLFTFPCLHSFDVFNAATWNFKTGTPNSINFSSSLSRACISLNLNKIPSQYCNYWRLLFFRLRLESIILIYGGLGVWSESRQWNNFVSRLKLGRNFSWLSIRISP